MLIEKILSDNQSGVDRAARDVATALSIPWIGYAQGDIISQPVIKSSFVEFVEHRLDNSRQVMEWHIRDSDAALILIEKWTIGSSARAIFAQHCAVHYCRPTLIINLGDYIAIERATAWLLGFRAPPTLNVVGPSVSESPGIYDAAAYFLEELLERSRP